tara:strand:+ start:1068 stop:1262 length:195 start_codon:yes stop_codon:yes gene_type:complete
MTKVMRIGAEEEWLEELDRVIHEFYRKRCWMRNLGEEDFPDYEETCDHIDYFINPLAKKFGLYP